VRVADIRLLTGAEIHDLTEGYGRVKADAETGIQKKA